MQARDYAPQNVHMSWFNIVANACSIIEHRLRASGLRAWGVEHTTQCFLITNLSLSLQGPVWLPRGSGKRLIRLVVLIPWVYYNKKTSSKGMQKTVWQLPVTVWQLPVTVWQLPTLCFYTKFQLNMSDNLQFLTNNLKRWIFQVTSL